MFLHDSKVAHFRGILLRLWQVTVTFSVCKKDQFLSHRLDCPSQVSQNIGLKNRAHGRQSISRPMRIVPPMPQEGGPRQNQQKKKTFFAQRFQTTSKQKCSNVRPLLSISFPQGFRISKYIGHPTSGSGGKKTVKKDRKPKKTEKSEEKKLFFARRFQTVFKQKCSYLKPLLPITFPQGFRISKNIGHPTLGSGGKKTVKKDRKPKKTQKKKINK